MLVDLRIFMQRSLRESAPGLDQLLLPPRNFLHPDVVQPVRPLKRLNDPLFGLVVLPLDHLIDLFELLIDLLHDHAVFII